MDAYSQPTPTGEERPAPSRWGLILRILAVLLVLVYVFHRPILKSAGEYLLYQDPPQKADLIVVLAGSPVVRAMAGADDYNRGLAPKVYLSRGNLEGAALAADLDLMDTGDWGLAFRVLTQRDVPPEAIVRETAFLDSTLAEARRLKTFIRGSGVKSIILVTSRYHSRRAWLIFTRTLGPGVRVVSRPSPYDPFDADGWWKDRAAAKRAVMEYQKLAYYYWETLWDKE